MNRMLYRPTEGALSTDAFPHREKARRRMRLAIAVLVLATAVVPLLLATPDYPFRLLLLTMILLDVCLYPALRYLTRREAGLPVLPTLCLSFAVQYAMPVFTQESGISTSFGFRYIDNSYVEAALVLSIIGVVILEVTYYFLIRNRVLKSVPTISLPLGKRRTEIYCIAVVLISLFLPRLQTVLPADTFLQFKAIVVLFENQVLVVIAVLGWLVYTGRGSKWHTLLLYIAVAIASLRGFSTTMLEMMVLPLAVFFMTKWLYTRRLPVATLAVIALIFVFLSPVKKNIRGAIVTGQTPAELSVTERASDWIEQALDYWRDTFTGNRNLVESTSEASNRADQIHNFAHIYSLTPSVLPYKYGETYSYLAIAWIPRIIWPEKPQANEANNYYAVAYQISTEEGVKRSSFGVSLMGEGYINFGASGVFLMMMVLGGVLAILQYIFAGPSSGPGGQAIFVATFVYFLNGIGTSAELMFGGLIQNLICAAVLLWFVKQRSSLTRVRFDLPVPAPSKQINS